MKYTFSAFSEYYRANVQGGLNAVVLAPTGMDVPAKALAQMIANGSTRRVAGEWVSMQHGVSCKNWRVVSASICR